MDETPYQYGYRQAHTSAEQVIPYDHTIYSNRLDKISYTVGWDNGFRDRLIKETTDAAGRLLESQSDSTP